MLVTGVYAASSRSARRSPRRPRCRRPTPATTGAAPMLVFSLARGRVAALVAVATRGGGPPDESASRRTTRCAGPCVAARLAVRVASAFVYYGYRVAARRVHRARLVGFPRRSAPARDQHRRDRHVRLGHARQRSLSLVAACAARPAVRLLRGRSDRDRARSGASVLWAFVTGCGNGAIFPLMMTLPLDAADKPEQVAGSSG